MQKIRKILGAVSEKTALPTNQPTNKLPTTPILWDLADAGPKSSQLTYLSNNICSSLVSSEELSTSSIKYLINRSNRSNQSNFKCLPSFKNTCG